jgi:hypothetical protein
MELRDLQQLGLQPDDERLVRHRHVVPRRAWHGRHGDQGRGRRVHPHLDHWPAGRAGGGDAREPDQGRCRLPAPTALPTATLGGGADGLFTKPAVADYPPYLQTACADEIAAGKSCTTVHYKSATRGYIESLGYEIVANFGDQYSDFTGGFEDRTFKMPNPNYFLP